jgi:hypothetical protein
VSAIVLEAPSQFTVERSLPVIVNVTEPVANDEVWAVVTAAVNVTGCPVTRLALLVFTWVTVGYGGDNAEAGPAPITNTDDMATTTAKSGANTRTRFDILLTPTVTCLPRWADPTNTAALTQLFVHP